MCTMCHGCGLELTKSGSGCNCQICTRSFCADCGKKEILSGLDGEVDPFLCCKICSQNHGKETSPQDTTSPCGTPSISPSISLSSYGSCLSSCGEFSMDVSIQSGVDGDDESPCYHQEDKPDFKNQSSSSSSHIPMREEDKHILITTENLKESSSEKLSPHDDSLKDFKPTSTGYASKGINNVLDNTSQLNTSSKEGVEHSQHLDIDTDPCIWQLPKPEDKEDDVECSVAHNDDDDDYSDGTKWGQPTSLSSSAEELGRSHRFKEERQKALLEVMNGRFRSLLSQLLVRAGVSFSEKACDNWLDIVSSLSWEAATLIKPNANEGRTMDPTIYVKVKCIASGSCSQSQVIRGLVFKKSAAHKHMPTKYKNPRLLLLQGVLGQRAGGLSSFNSMDQEKDYLRSTIEMMETCQPNVVLVEKTVSRDVQESLLSKGITLVYDMKLPRLERISRCTGSQIVSSADSLVHLELKQCDSFHIVKFVEEHNSSGEGGKRLSKTLMFFEGCPKPLGCTILLKGAHSDELKKVKCVVQQAIFLAYHLILETSFLVDQRATFLNAQTAGMGNGFATEKQLPCCSPSALNSDIYNPASLRTSDIPISNGFHDKSVRDGRSCHSDLDSQGNTIISSSSADINSYDNDSNQRTMLNYTYSSSLVHRSETSHEQLSDLVLPGKLLSSHATVEGVNEKEPYGLRIGIIHVSSSLGKLDCETEENEIINQEKPQGASCDVEKVNSMQVSSGLYSENCDTDVSKDALLPFKEDIETESDPQCILVLQSGRCVLRGTIVRKVPLFCRINYYGDSDMSLGSFLLNYILNQKNQCSTCGEPPEGHVYSYTHQNGKLTILVKRLLHEFILPGEAEGRLWMWTRCLKCEENGVPKATRRVVMSSAARGLSVGKFFELGFSSRLASSIRSNCGHFLHKDCLQFYGLGSTVAMFRYSSLEVYKACMPPPVLEFNNPIGQEWLDTEAKDVFEKGNLLFMEVMNSLQNMVSMFSLWKKPANFTGSIKEVSDVEEMLRQEKSDFEALLHKAINKNGRHGQPVHQILRLNRLNHELLLQLYVWDRRLHALGLSFAVNNGTSKLIHEEQSQLQEDESGRIIEERSMESNDSAPENPTCVPSLKYEQSLAYGEKCHSSHCSNTKTELDLELENTSQADESVLRDVSVPQPLLAVAEQKSWHLDNGVSDSVSTKDALVVRSSIEGSIDVSSCDHSLSRVCNSFSGEGLSSRSCHHSLIDDHLQPARVIPSAAERCTESIANLSLKTEMVDGSTVDEANESAYSLPSDIENSEDWVWTPFLETRKAYRKDLQRGYSQKFEFINSYSPEYLPPVNQLITQEISQLHFPVDTDDNVVSVYEDEFSSIIACALVLLQDRYGSMDNMAEKDSRKEREKETDKSTDSLPGLASDVTTSIPHWWSSSNSLVDLEGSHSGQSVCSEDSSSSGSDGFFTAEPLLSSRALHPEIPLGVGKLPGKSKYSVVCIHAKQFYSLRRRCCPSELDYISSLSRCKKWDAQGGKSGVYFAKTLDDRFIVKQVKKTELDSFLKFAPEYFNHISHSLSTGSQTCLAKILGIYQVIIRQSKSGKEVKIDLIVMENLFFGHNISRMYDLKGALHRNASEKNGTRKVLLDQNFVDDMNLSPFYVSLKTKHLLQRGIWNDTSFLTSINVMDYSLLLGVDKQRHEIVFGIIDYLRQYTWDKHLETWVKASLVVPKNELPTVISPKEYKKRFRNFMSANILTVPDRWCTERFPGRQKVCCEGSDENVDLIEKSNR